MFNPGRAAKQKMSLLVDFNAFLLERLPPGKGWRGKRRFLIGRCHFPSHF